MPSADFCALTVAVSNDGAIGGHHEMLRGSYVPEGLLSVNSEQISLGLVPVGPFRIFS